MDDESYVVADFKQLPARCFYRSNWCFGVTKRFEYQRLTKLPKNSWHGRPSVRVAKEAQGTSQMGT